MIQGITESTISAAIETKDNRITTLASSQIRHLIKFIRDIDENVYYAYAATETIYDRYTQLTWTYNNDLADTNRYLGEIHLIPSGHYKYELYEVTWAGTVTVSAGNAPATETDVLSPPAATKGIVQGLVTKGLMYLTDKTGTAQVQYTQQPEPSGSNYIYYGQ